MKTSTPSSSRSQSAALSARLGLTEPDYLLDLKTFRKRVRANTAAMRITKTELLELERLHCAKRNIRAARKSEERKKEAASATRLENVALRAENASLRRRNARLVRINEQIESRLLAAAAP